MIVFSYYPAASALYHSFFNWEPGYASPFTGIENYRQILSDSIFWHSFVNVGKLFLFGITVALVVPFMVAELLIRLKSARLQYVFRALLILPMTFPGIVTILLWSFMFNPDTGLLNTVLHLLGSHATVNWIGSPSIALYSLMLMGIPWVAGVTFLLMLSGLQAIPLEIFAAASVDGATGIRRILHIDIPLLLPVLRILLVLSIVGWLQNITVMLVLTNGGPDYATMVPALWAYLQAFTFGNWGYAAALSSVLFVLMAGLSIVAWKMVRGGSDND